MFYVVSICNTHLYALYSILSLITDSLLLFLLDTYGDKLLWLFFLLIIYRLREWQFSCFFSYRTKQETINNFDEVMSHTWDECHFFCVNLHTKIIWSVGGFEFNLNLHTRLIYKLTNLFVSIGFFFHTFSCGSNFFLLLNLRLVIATELKYN